MTTPPPLPAARVEEIRARLEKATPGKWTGKENDWNEVHIRAPSRKHKTEIAAVSVGYNEPMEGEQRANINLICNAPADIAALLAEVERRGGMMRQMLDALTAATVELNAIRARDGAPQHIDWHRGWPMQTASCTEEWWDTLTERCLAAVAVARAALGEDSSHG